MREKYESLPLVQLKALAKVRGLKGTSAMKKTDLVEAMLAADRNEGSQSTGESAPSTVQSSQTWESTSSKESNTETADSKEVRTISNTVKKTAEKPAGDIATSNVEEKSITSQTTQENTMKTTPLFSGKSISQATGKSFSAGSASYSKESGQERKQDSKKTYRVAEVYDEHQYPKELDSGEAASGILEVMPDGYGFIRCENYLPGENDVYVAPSQIRRFGLKTGDILVGNKRVKTQQEKFSALLFIKTINGYTTEESAKRMSFEDMTPIFPNERVRLETQGCSIAMRVMDLICPVGKGQRGMIVSPPKAGKTTLIKDVARSILRTNPKMHMIILLIDERPEEVTDIKEAIIGDNVEVIYSTFDELPEHHKRVSEMVMERAKRLVEHKMEVVILLDSITRLTRAYNQVVPPSGRTLSGGLDPSALHMPKRFFGAARNMREGGSLTILATALVDTGSKMDDVVYEEFKGTGNMEMVLDRKLSERRIFPAIDIQKSGTRREDLLLTSEELEAINIMRKALNSLKADEAADKILDMFSRTRTNADFVNLVKRQRFI
jgi:transcription termination factor Rho